MAETLVIEQGSPDRNTLTIEEDVSTIEVDTTDEEGGVLTIVQGVDSVDLEDAGTVAVLLVETEITELVVEPPEITELVINTADPGRDGKDGKDGKDGTDGAPGPPGPTGPPGGSATANFAIASTVWTYVHNLGYPPAVMLQAQDGTEIEGNVTANDGTTTTAEFFFPVAGKMTLS